MILPSGNTIDKTAADKLRRKKDPYNRTMYARNAIPNRFAKQVKELIENINFELSIFDDTQLKVAKEPEVMAELQKEPKFEEAKN